MNADETLPILALLALLLAAGAFFLRRIRHREQLQLLAQRDNVMNIAYETGLDWERGGKLLGHLGDRLGRAGFIDDRQRQNVKTAIFLAALWGGALGGVIGGRLGGAFTAFALALGGLYVAVTGIAIALRMREQNYEREIYFQTPIFLESIILLVESGLGVLPALEKIVRSREENEGSGAVSRLFHLVYQLSSHGTPLTQALETVAERVPQRIVRHVMLHIDLSGNEGGELIPSLRSLSEYAHNEWRLSVEQRVKRLENLVVFPVFASVMGLMLLIAAVPMVPLLDLKELLDKGKQGAPFANGGLK